MTAHDGQARALFRVPCYQQQGWIAKYDPATNSSLGKISTHVESVVLEAPNTQGVLVRQGLRSLPQAVDPTITVLPLSPERCRSFCAIEEDRDIALAPLRGPRLFNIAKADPLPPLHPRGTPAQ